MYLKTTLSGNRYKVVWLVAKNALVFKKGPKRKQPRVVTTCWISELTDRGQEEVGFGQTLQSWRDEHCEHMCRKVSLVRALEDSPLGKPARTEFWTEFFERYPKPVPVPVPVLLPEIKVEPDVPYVSELELEAEQHRASSIINSEAKKPWWKFWRRK